MKSFQFKRKESVLRVAEEEKKAPKPKRNWDRVVYFVFLGLVLFFLGKFAFNKYFYVSGHGQVLFENVHIRHTKDIKISKFLVHEGDEVAEGDTIFQHYVEIENDGGGNGVHVNLGNQNSSADRLERDILQTQKQIRLAKADIEGLESRLTRLRQTFSEQKRQVVLELISRNHLDNTNSAIDKTQAELTTANLELKELINYLALLRSTTQEQTAQKSIPYQTNININNNAESRSPFASRRYQPYLAPISGTVTKIFKQEHEVALKSENIMSIHKAENIYIKAYFDQEDLQQLAAGDILNLQFADGSKSKGRVERFYYATYRLPEEFQNKYEPTTRTLAADIYPLDDTQVDKWKAYYKMSVDIRKRKF